MLGFLSFVWLLAVIACAGSVIGAVVSLVKKRKVKSFIIVGVVSAVTVVGLMAPISALYVPAEKPVEEVAVAEAETEAEPEPVVEPVPVSPAASVSPAETETVAEDISVSTKPETQVVPDPVPKKAEPEPVNEAAAVVDEKPAASSLASTSVSKPAPKKETPKAQAPTASSASSSTTPKSSSPESKPLVAASSTVSSGSDSEGEEEDGIDTEMIRRGFDLLLENPDYDGAIVSIEPRTIDGEVFSWKLIDVVVPDAWYYLEDFQKQRYCANVGDFVRAIAVEGGAADSEDGVGVYFYDVAGAEVAKSTLFSGYKVLK